jgi:hypothetical protein
VDPLGDLQALARAPLDVARDLRVIADAITILPEIEAAVRGLPAIGEALRILPAIESQIASLSVAVESMLADVNEVRRVVASQQLQVTHIEQMIQRLDQRTGVIERTVVDLQTKADHAMRLLPDPDGDNRTVLEKAKDVIAATG